MYKSYCHNGMGDISSPFFFVNIQVRLFIYLLVCVCVELTKNHSTTWDFIFIMYVQTIYVFNSQCIQRICVDFMRRSTRSHMHIYLYIRPIQPDGIYLDCHLHLTAVRCVCRRFGSSFYPDSQPADCCSFFRAFGFFFWFFGQFHHYDPPVSHTQSNPHIGYALLAASAFEIVQISDSTPLQSLFRRALHKL